MLPPDRNPDQHERADVLLVTATEVEARTLLALFEEELNHRPRRCFIGDKTYFDLGITSNTRIFMVRSEMGTSGPHEALLTVYKGIKALSPSAVILLGIAFGIDEQKQQIGDILVSRQLLGYEQQKIATDNGDPKVVLRGDRPSPPPGILDRFRSGALDWTGAAVEFGLILSGEKVIDYLGFRNRLLEFAPDAIGGEMEGVGLYSAAYSEKVDWIVVKAICDWADGDKSKDKVARQQQAAQNAARFTIHVLRQGGFAPSSVGVLSSSESAETPEAAAASCEAVGTTLCTYDIHSSWVVAVAWEPRGNRIASAGHDGLVRIWDARTGNTLLTYRGHTWRFARVNMPPAVYNIAWSPEGLRIVSAGDGAKVYVWNATTGQNLSIYQGHSGLFPNVYAIGWSPDGTRIASACSMTGFDKTVHVWDAVTARTNLSYISHYGLLPNFSVLALAWSPDGAFIASTCGDKAIRIWDAATGHHLLTCHTGTDWVNNIAWSPDSRHIASANANHTAQIWDTRTGKLVLTYYGHKASVRDIAWSPACSQVATASNDTTVQLWNPTSGAHTYTYRGHSKWATSIAWSPDGKRIASGSNDQTVQIWQASN